MARNCVIGSGATFNAEAEVAAQAAALEEATLPGIDDESLQTTNGANEEAAKSSDENSEAEGYSSEGDSVSEKSEESVGVKKRKKS